MSWVGGLRSIDDLAGIFYDSQEIKVTGIFVFIRSIAKGFYINGGIVFYPVGAVKKQFNAFQFIHPGKFGRDDCNINVTEFPGSSCGIGAKKDDFLNRDTLFSFVYELRKYFFNAIFPVNHCIVSCVVLIVLLAAAKL